MNKKLFCSLLIIGGLLPFNIKTSQISSQLAGAAIVGTAGGAIVGITYLLTQASQEDWLPVLWKLQIKLGADLGKESSIDKLKWSRTIEGKIDHLIKVQFNLKFPGIPEDRFDAFPTIQSKISVLQNIEDFFYLPTDPTYKKFNLLVYKACMSKINQLEISKPNDPLLDNEEINKSIQQIKQLYSLPQSYSNMSPDQLQNHINHVQGMIGYHYYYSTPENPFFDKNNPKFRAHVAILMHLLFKQSTQKPPAISSTESTQAAEKFSRLGQATKKELAQEGVKEIKFAEDHDPKAIQKALTEKYTSLQLDPIKLFDPSEQEAILQKEEAARKAFQERPWWRQALDWLGMRRKF